MKKVIGFLLFLSLSIPPVLAGEVSFRRTDMDVGGIPRFITVGDFNQDQILDLALAVHGPIPPTLMILLGNGDGTFEHLTNIERDHRPSFIVTADFDGDDILDLAVADGIFSGEDPRISIFHGSGDGFFTEGESYEVPPAPLFMDLGDFNGDGKLDLIVSNAGSHSVSILLGNGDGTFAPAKVIPVFSDTQPRGVAAGDFNGDGYDDFVVAEYRGPFFRSFNIAVFLNNKDGTFGPGQIYTVTQEPGSFAIGDFNGDKILDLAVNGFEVSVLLGRGDGTFQEPRNYNPNASSRAIAIGDFNADGVPDLVLSGGVIFLGQGDGTFQGPHRFSSIGDPVAVGDFNGDDLDDIALADQNLSIFINTLE